MSHNKITPQLNYIPVSSIISQKIISRASFYRHLKTGGFKLYKIGNRSFVSKEEFESFFQPVEFAKK